MFKRVVRRGEVNDCIYKEADSCRVQEWPDT